MIRTHPRSVATPAAERSSPAVRASRPVASRISSATGTGSFQKGVNLGRAEQRLGGLAGAEGAVTPRLVHLDQQERQVAIFWGLGLGLADDEAPAGIMRQRGPHLLPVDDPLVALEPRAGLHIGEV